MERKSKEKLRICEQAKSETEGRLDQEQGNLAFSSSPAGH